MSQNLLEARTAFVCATFAIAVVEAGLALMLLHRMVARHHGPTADPGASEPARLGWFVIVLAAGCSFSVFGLAAAATLGLGFGGFGLIHLAYVSVAIVPAVLGIAILRLAARGNPVRVSASKRLFAGLLLLAPVVCAYASFVEPYQLVVERCEVPIAGLTRADEPIRIAVLADIQTDHVSAHEHHAVDLALAERPDLIVLPGDIFQGREPTFRRELPAMRALLGRLDAPFGVFACIGNVDNPARTPELTEGTRVRMLFNEIEVIEIRGRRVAIGGVDWKCYSRLAQETFRRMAAADADIRILLSHCPDGALVARPTDRIDLLIAGHTHGGQVALPGFGPLMTASAVPRSVAAGGLHRLNDQLMYVSRGVGFERGWAPPMRLFCRPEVSILWLRGKP